MKPRAFFLKTYALVTAISILVTGTLSPSAYAISPPAPKISFSIPSALGSVDTFVQKSGKTVFYIQDAHDSLEAQQNIAKLIEHFVTQRGVKTVFEEGYEGPVPTDDYFGFIGEASIREKLAAKYLDELRLGGAEYAHITRKADFRLVGADHLELYFKNIQAYRDMAAAQKETLEDLSRLKAEIQNLAQRHFPLELKSWLKEKDRFDAGELDLLSYIERTLARELRLLEGLPNLKLLYLAYKNQDKTASDKLKNLHARELFEELQGFERNYAASFLKNSRDLKIYDYLSSIKLLEKLAQIRLTDEEFEAVRSRIETIKTQAIADFISAEIKKSIALSRAWEDWIRPAIRFYEIAHERNLAVEKKLVEFSQSDEKETILVYGGFHRNAIQSLLEKHGFSYGVLSPKISTADTAHTEIYRRRMTSAPVSPSLVSKAARSPWLLLEPNAHSEIRRDYEKELTRSEMRESLDGVRKGAKKFVKAKSKRDLSFMRKIVEEQVEDRKSAIKNLRKWQQTVMVLKGFGLLLGSFFLATLWLAAPILLPLDIKLKVLLIGGSLYYGIGLTWMLKPSSFYVENLNNAFKDGFILKILQKEIKKQLKPRRSEMRQNPKADIFYSQPNFGHVNAGIEAVIREIRLLMNEPEMGVKALADQTYRTLAELESKEKGQRPSGFRRDLQEMYMLWIQLSEIKSVWKTNPEKAVHRAMLKLEAHFILPSLSDPQQKDDFFYTILNALLAFSQVRSKEQVAVSDDDDYYENYWGWALALSHRGGRQALDLLEAELHRVGNEKFDPSDDKNHHWSAAYQEILLEAIYLAATFSADHVDQKKRILEKAQALDSPHVKNLAAYLLTKKLAQTSHPAQDFHILKLYRDVRVSDQRNDYTSAVTMDKKKILWPARRRSEMRTLENVKAYRADIVARITSEENLGAPRNLSEQEVTRHLIAFEQALLAAPGVLTETQMNFDITRLLRAQLFWKLATETETTLDNGTHITVLSFPFDNEKIYGMQIFKYKNRTPNKEDYLGYGSYTAGLWKEPREGGYVAAGFHLFGQFRDGKKGIRGADIYELHLKSLYQKFRPDDFIVQVQSQIAKTRVGNPVRNALFYLKRGFYPPDWQEHTDHLLNLSLDGNKLRSADIDPLFQSIFPYWVLPLRSEVRASVSKNPASDESVKKNAAFYDFGTEKEFARTHLAPESRYKIYPWEEAASQAEAGIRDLIIILNRLPYLYTSSWSHSALPSDHYDETIDGIDHHFGRVPPENYLSAVSHHNAPFTSIPHAGFISFRADESHPDFKKFRKRLLRISGVQIVDSLYRHPFGKESLILVPVPQELIHLERQNDYESYLKSKWAEILKAVQDIVSRNNENPSVRVLQLPRSEARNPNKNVIYKMYPKLAVLRNAWLEFLENYPAEKAKFASADEGGTFVPSSPEWAEILRDTWKLTASSHVLDVGSGNGLMAFAIHILSGAVVTSIEIDQKRWEVLQAFLRFLKEEKGIEYPKVRFRQADFLETPLEGYHLIYFYFASPKKYKKALGNQIVSKLEKELPADTPFVSPNFYLEEEISADAILKTGRTRFFSDTQLNYEPLHLTLNEGGYSGEGVILTRRSEMRDDKKSESRSNEKNEKEKKAAHLKRLIGKMKDAVEILFFIFLIPVMAGVFGLMLLAVKIANEPAPRPKNKLSPSSESTVQRSETRFLFKKWLSPSEESFQSELAPHGLLNLTLPLETAIVLGEKVKLKWYFYLLALAEPAIGISLILYQLFGYSRERTAFIDIKAKLESKNKREVSEAKKALIEKFEAYLRQKHNSLARAVAYEIFRALASFSPEFLKQFSYLAQSVPQEYRSWEQKPHPAFRPDLFDAPASLNPKDFMPANHYIGLYHSGILRDADLFDASAEADWQANPWRRRSEMRNFFEQEIALLSDEEKVIYERARKISGLKIGIDIESTLTSNFPMYPQVYPIDVIHGKIPGEFGSVNLSEFKTRLMTPGMKALILGLLENNEIKIITMMHGNSLFQWRQAVPFLGKLLASGQIKLIDGLQVAKEAKKHITYNIQRQPETRVFLNGHELSVFERRSIFSFEPGPSWRSLKAPKLFKIDVLIDDSPELPSIMKKLQMGEVITVPRYRLHPPYALSNGKYTLLTKFEYSKPGSDDPKEEILITPTGIALTPNIRQEPYLKAAQLVMPTLEKLEQLAEQKKHRSEMRAYVNGVDRAIAYASEILREAPPVAPEAQIPGRGKVIDLMAFLKGREDQEPFVKGVVPQLNRVSRSAFQEEASFAEWFYMIMSEINPSWKNLYSPDGKAKGYSDELFIFVNEQGKITGYLKGSRTEGSSTLTASRIATLKRTDRIHGRGSLMFRHFLNKLKELNVRFMEIELFEEAGEKFLHDFLPRENILYEVSDEKGGWMAPDPDLKEIPVLIRLDLNTYVPRSEMRSVPKKYRLKNVLKRKNIKRIRAKQADPKKYWIDVLTAAGEKTGVKKSKKRIHENGDWHGVVAVLLTHRDNIILSKLSNKKRDASKFHFPIQGHLNTGETNAQGAVRESYEESKLRITQKSLKKVASYPEVLEVGKYTNREHVFIYKRKVSKSELQNLRPNPAEMTEFVIMPIPFFKQLLKNNPRLFTSRLKNFFKNHPEGKKFLSRSETRSSDPREPVAPAPPPAPDVEILQKGHPDYAAIFPDDLETEDGLLGAFEKLTALAGSKNRKMLIRVRNEALPESLWNDFGFEKIDFHDLLIEHLSNFYPDLSELKIEGNTVLLPLETPLPGFEDYPVLRISPLSTTSREWMKHSKDFVTAMEAIRRNQNFQTQAAVYRALRILLQQRLVEDSSLKAWGIPKDAGLQQLLHFAGSENLSKILISEEQSRAIFSEFKAKMNEYRTALEQYKLEKREAELKDLAGEFKTDVEKATADLRLYLEQRKTADGVSLSGAKAKELLQSIKEIESLPFETALAYLHKKESSDQARTDIRDKLAQKIENTKRQIEEATIPSSSAPLRAGELFPGLNRDLFQSWFMRLASVISGEEVLSWDQAVLIYAYYPDVFTRFDYSIAVLLSLIARDAPASELYHKAERLLRSGIGWNENGRAVLTRDQAKTELNFFINRMEGLSSVFVEKILDSKNTKPGDFKTFYSLANFFVKSLSDPESVYLKEAELTQQIARDMVDDEVGPEEIAKKFEDLYALTSLTSVVEWISYQHYQTRLLQHYFQKGQPTTKRFLQDRLDRIEEKLSPPILKVYKAREKEVAHLLILKSGKILNPGPLLHNLENAVASEDLSEAVDRAFQIYGKLQNLSLNDRERDKRDVAMENLSRRMKDPEAFISFPQREEAQRILDQSQELIEQARAAASAEQSLALYEKALTEALKAAVILPDGSSGKIKIIYNGIYRLASEKYAGLVEKSAENAPEENEIDDLILIYEKIAAFLNAQNPLDFPRANQLLSLLQRIDSDVQELKDLKDLQKEPGPERKETAAVSATAPEIETIKSDYRLAFTSQFFQQAALRWKRSESFRAKFPGLLKELLEKGTKGQKKTANWNGLWGARIERSSYRIYWRVDGQQITFVGLFHKEDTVDKGGPADLYLEKTAALKGADLPLQDTERVRAFLARAMNLQVISRSEMRGSFLLRPDNVKLIEQFNASMNGQSLFWNDAAGREHEARTVASQAIDYREGDLGYYDEIVLHVFPTEKEKTENPELEMLSLEPELLGLPKKGAFGRLIVQEFLWESEPVLYVREIQSGAGLHSLKPEEKKHYRVWKNQLLTRMAQIGRQTGYRHLFVKHYQTVRRENPGKKQPGIRNPRSMTDANLVEHYKLPFRKKDGWKIFDIPIEGLHNVQPVWHLNLRSEMRKNDYVELLRLAEEKLKLVFAEGQRMSLRIVRNDTALSLTAAYKIHFPDKKSKSALLTLKFSGNKKRASISAVSDADEETISSLLKQAQRSGFPSAEIISAKLSFELDIPLESDWDLFRQTVLSNIVLARGRMLREVLGEEGKPRYFPVDGLKNIPKFPVPTREQLIRFYEDFGDDGNKMMPDGIHAFPMGMIQMHPDVLNWYMNLISEFGNNLDILILGAGTGDLENKLVENGHRVKIVEFVPKNAERLKRQNLDVLEADAQKPLALDKQYDLILMIDSIGQMEPKIVIPNLKNWIKPNGWVLLTTPTSTQPMTRQEYDISLYNRYPLKYLSTILNDSGFENTTAGSVPLVLDADRPPLFLQSIKARLPKRAETRTISSTSKKGTIVILAEDLAGMTSATEKDELFKVAYAGRSELRFVVSGDTTVLRKDIRFNAFLKLPNVKTSNTDLAPTIQQFGLSKQGAVILAKQKQSQNIAYSGKWVLLGKEGRIALARTVAVNNGALIPGMTEKDGVVDASEDFTRTLVQNQISRWVVSYSA